MAQTAVSTPRRRKGRQGNHGEDDGSPCRGGRVVGARRKRKRRRAANEACVDEGPQHTESEGVVGLFAPADEPQSANLARDMEEAERALNKSAGLRQSVGNMSWG